MCFRWLSRSKMNQQTPVAVLNNIMTKLRVVPKYEMVQGEHGETLFMMKVTCQMMPDGKILSACGSYGRSKQEAKHNAAIAFLTKFCNNGNIETERKTNTDNEQKTNTEITYRGSQMLLVNIKKETKITTKMMTFFHRNYYLFRIFARRTSWSGPYTRISTSGDLNSTLSG